MGEKQRPRRASHRSHRYLPLSIHSLLLAKNILALPSEYTLAQLQHEFLSEDLKESKEVSECYISA